MEGNGTLSAVWTLWAPVSEFGDGGCEIGGWAGTCATEAAGQSQWATLEYFESCFCRAREEQNLGLHATLTACPRRSQSTAAAQAAVLNTEASDKVSSFGRAVLPAVSRSEHSRTPSLMVTVRLLLQLQSVGCSGGPIRLRARYNCSQPTTVSTFAWLAGCLSKEPPSHRITLHQAALISSSGSLCTGGSFHWRLWVIKEKELVCVCLVVSCAQKCAGPGQREQLKTAPPVWPVCVRLCCCCCCARCSGYNFTIAADATLAHTTPDTGKRPIRLK